MEAEIPASALKPFYKALQCLSRVGSEISIEAQESHLELNSVNMARSAFASFTFHQHFFDSYKVTRQAQASQSQPALQCKVLARPLVGIFKTRSQGQGRTVEKCILRIEQNSSMGGSEGGFAGECRLVARIAYKEGICRTHRLFYEVSETLHPAYDKQEFKSQWQVDAKVAAEWVGHFARGLAEVSMWMSASEVRLRSWSESRYSTNGRTQIDTATAATERALQTELTLVPAEFDSYSLAGTRPIELTYSLREFRAVLQYAEAVGQPMMARFNKGGDPLMLSVGPSRQPGQDIRGTIYSQAPDDVTAEFLIATLTDYAVSQSGSSAYGSPYNQRPAHDAAISIQSADTPARPMICERVDEISVHSEDRHSRSGLPGTRDGPGFDSKMIPSPSPYQSSREGDYVSPGLNMELDRADSLLSLPSSVASNQRAHPLRTSNGGYQRGYNNSSGSAAPNAANQTGGSTPVLYTDNQNTRTYRLSDMPRPQAPPGVTEALFSEQESQSQDPSDAAPLGRVQTRLPYQRASHVQQQS
ncbi:hypothetical protein IWW36_002215 [Coemansia brasiliensis]|uniref:Uncharacterized protein n=1 Tax=Coemansia brasiliensis TaxID=2650707 RepID=A0A9W8IGB8_9FUNG|nr:hypothetical protein IWW36_002215 [Coemansia brasiliensis]